ncbi:MBL fold metallo-hydrolase [bacterium]|nr:MBL fold metallo-hydrolase [bacterium]
MKYEIKDLIIEREILGDVSTNSFLVYTENSKDCFIVDLGDFPSDHMKTIEKKSLNLKYILFTHGHYDHIFGLDKMPESNYLKIMIDENDGECIPRADRNLSCFVGVPFQCDKAYETYDLNTPFKCGNMEISIHSTPGHTAGSICILVNDILFSGDTIFQQSIGRTDLPGGDHTVILESIDKICKTFPDDTVIFPGHGDPTDLKSEKTSNPFFPR